MIYGNVRAVSAERVFVYGQRMFATTQYTMCACVRVRACMFAHFRDMNNIAVDVHKFVHHRAVRSVRSKWVERGWGICCRCLSIDIILICHPQFNHSLIMLQFTAAGVAAAAAAAPAA